MGEGGGSGDGGQAAAAARLLVEQCGVAGTDAPAGSRAPARPPLQGCQLLVHLGRGCVFVEWQLSPWLLNWM